MNEWPHEPDEFIDRLVQDIMATFKGDEPYAILYIGAGDGYEAKRIEEKADVLVDQVEAFMNWVAIGAATERATFYSYGSLGLSSLYKRKSMEAGASRPIMTISLDDYCWANRMEPDGLIIDAEGATGDILAGGFETLKTVRFIAAETETAEIFLGAKLDADIDAFLGSMGFKRTRIEEAKGVPQRNSVWVRT